MSYPLNNLSGESQKSNYIETIISQGAKKYSAIIDLMREAWQQNTKIFGDSLPILIEKVIHATRMDENWKDKNLKYKSIIPIIRSMYGTEHYERFALSSLRVIITDADPKCRICTGYYKTVCLPAVTQLLQLITVECPINPSKVTDEELYDIGVLLLQDERKDMTNANKLRALKPEVDIFNIPHPKTGKTMLQTLADTGNQSGINHLIDNGADPNICCVGTTPLIITLLKKFDIRFFEEVITKAQNINPNHIDEFGHTAQYYLSMKHKTKHPESLKLNVNGLSNILKEIFYEGRAVNTNKYLTALIHAWKDEKNLENELALSESTRIFLKKCQKTGQHTREFRELINLLKDEPYFEEIVLDFVHAALKNRTWEGLELPKTILIEFIKDLDLAKIKIETARNILLESLNDDVNDDAIADALVEVMPELVTASPPNVRLGGGEVYQNPLRVSVEKNNEHGLRYLIRNGACLEQEKDIVNLALKSRHREMAKLLVELGADINGRDSNHDTPLATACSQGDEDIVDFLLGCEGINPGIPNNYGLIPFQIAQDHKHPSIAKKLLEKFGEEQFAFLYNKYKFLLQETYGVTEETFPYIVREEIDRTKSMRTGFAFDEKHLITFSKVYSKFWKEALLSPDEIDQHIEAFPYKNSIVCFLKQQKELFNQMQNDARMKDFPIDQLWQFAIDSNRYSKGICAFENEPGYLKSFFKGMTKALKTRGVRKTAEWYLELHRATVSEAYSSQTQGQKWYPALNACRKIPLGVRKIPCSFCIGSLDQDSYGIEDLKTRANVLWSYRETDQRLSFSFPDNGEVEEQLKTIFDKYNALYDRAKNPAEKLLAALFTARDLEINHIFMDGNGRGSHIALISMVAKEKELPMFLFANPNVFDGNGPESLAYRYLEGCLNFRKGNGGLYFMPNNKVKNLDSLDLSEHSDLERLRDELKPLVCNKTWQEALDCIG